MNQLSEQELINGCRKNSRKYQEVLYMRFFDIMFGMCMRHVQDEELAISVLNDGFLNVFKHISQFRGDGSLEAWIRKIIFNRIADHFRIKKNNIKYVELSEHYSPAEEASEIFGYEEIRELTGILSDKEREVFLLYAIEGYKHKEISEMLGMPVGTSKWYLSEARAKMKQKLMVKNKELRKHEK
jgi:RNA polymerase sigma-70 factor (ECF subfamily)